MVRITAPAGTLGVDVICILMSVYFVAYPLLCVMVIVLIEYRTLSRNSLSE